MGRYKDLSYPQAFDAICDNPENADLVRAYAHRE
jgi:hypothetical protein